MGEIVSFSRARKTRARAGKRAQAAENRIRHGLTRDERSQLEASRSMDKKRLDDAKREP